MIFANGIVYMVKEWGRALIPEELHAWTVLDQTSVYQWKSH